MAKTKDFVRAELIDALTLDHVDADDLIEECLRLEHILAKLNPDLWPDLYESLEQLGYIYYNSYDFSQPQTYSPLALEEILGITDPDLAYDKARRVCLTSFHRDALPKLIGSRPDFLIAKMVTAGEIRIIVGDDPNANESSAANVVIHPRHTVRLVEDGVVDPKVLPSKFTQAIVGAGEVIIMDPALMHTVITTGVGDEGSRQSTSNFFRMSR
ncbi:hypothetical protein KC878_04685 [Candidatus Saccharibacteria bacterium]|nr:hypothetical protein [Candidatus Saccharibacteria bacterium]MCB9820958.1 hypothetical protein [Candidatus Nomurabacteria bacterium]